MIASIPQNIDRSLAVFAPRKSAAGAGSPLNQACRRPAFTLLELLVALAIVAMIAVILFASLSTAFKSRQSAEAMLDPVRRGAVAMEILRNDLENAIPPNPNAATVPMLAGNFEGVTQQGAAGYRNDDLQFFIAGDGPAHPYGDCDIKGIELTVKPPDDPHLGTDPVLVRRVTSNLLLPQNQTQQPDEEVICRGVTGFMLRYWDGANWDDTWDSTQTNVLPQAVEVTLDLQPSPDRPNQQAHYRRVFMLSTYSAAGGNGNIGLPPSGF